MGCRSLVGFGFFVVVIWFRIGLGVCFLWVLGFGVDLEREIRFLLFFIVDNFFGFRGDFVCRVVDWFRLVMFVFFGEGILEFFCNSLVFFIVLRVRLVLVFWVNRFVIWLYLLFLGVFLVFDLVFVGLFLVLVGIFVFGFGFFFFYLNWKL